MGNLPQVQLNIRYYFLKPYLTFCEIITKLRMRLRFGMTKVLSKVIAAKNVYEILTRLKVNGPTNITALEDISHNVKARRTLNILMDEGIVQSYPNPYRSGMTMYELTSKGELFVLMLDCCEHVILGTLNMEDDEFHEVLEILDKNEPLSSISRQH